MPRLTSPTIRTLPMASRAVLMAALFLAAVIPSPLLAGTETDEAAPAAEVLETEATAFPTSTPSPTPEPTPTSVPPTPTPTTVPPTSTPMPPESTVAPPLTATTEPTIVPPATATVTATATATPEPTATLEASATPSPTPVVEDVIDDLMAVLAEVDTDRELPPCTPTVSASGLDFGRSTWSGSAYPALTGTLNLTVSEDGENCSGIDGGWDISVRSDGLSNGTGGAIGPDAITYLGGNGCEQEALAPAPGFTLSAEPQRIATTVGAPGGCTWSAPFQLQPEDAPAGSYQGQIHITMENGQ